MVKILELPGEIWQIDLEDCGHPGRTAGYFVKGLDEWMLVETGPANSLDKILEAAIYLDITPENLKYIAVTHIHLDHAGGLGVTADYFNQADLIVHYKGARHMVDPTRLIAGATEAWGSKRMNEFGKVKPVAEERIISVQEGGIIDLGNRIIEVWETPGHAKHHACFYDRKTKGLFSGDAAGVYHPLLSHTLQRPVVRPATPAPDFEGDKMIKSLIRMAMAEIEVIYFTHFGTAHFPQQIVERQIGQLIIQMELAKKFSQEANAEQMLREAVLRQLHKGLGVTAYENIPNYDPQIQEELSFLTDLLNLSVAGLLQYCRN